jgi:multimeric flavodoxin WrbA
MVDHMTPKILIIYHSQTGNTEKMAKAVLEGVEKAGGIGTLKNAMDATFEDLLDSDAIVIGTPEYFGYMAGIVKDFFDRTYERALKEPSVKRKPYALFISAGNDGEGARLSVERVCIGLKLKKVQEVIIAKGTPSQETIESLKELGMAITLGVQEKIF